MAPPSESLTLRAAQAGDGAAFAALVGPHLPALAAFIGRACPRRDLTEDVLQETLLRAWRHLGGFRGASSLRTWLCAIAWRTAQTMVTRAGDVPRDDVPELPDLAPGPAERAIGRVLVGQALRLLAQLRPVWREAITRVDVRGQPLPAAARDMGIPLGTLKTHLHRGRRALARLRDSDEGMAAR